MSKAVDFSKISAFKGPEESPGFLLWKVSTLWRRSIESALKLLNLTHPQFVVLATIGWLTKGGESVSQVAIGKQAGLDPNTTSQIIRSLEKKALVERLQSVDERSKCPVLTKTGSQLLTKALPAVEKADKEFFSKAKSNSKAFAEVLAELL